MSVASTVRRSISVVVAVCVLATIGPTGALGVTPEDPPVETEPATDPLIEDLAADEALPPPDPQPSMEDLEGPGLPLPEPAHEHGDEDVAASALGMLRVPSTPTALSRVPLDSYPGFQPTVSCSPANRPGVTAFAALLGSHYGKTRHHISRTCRAGDYSQHYDGRALDWTLNANNAADRAIANSANGWLTANNGAVAKRFGIMYIIWNRKIWYTHRPGAWEAYNGPSPHTDHIHFSFTWDGAMKRTSWWTSTAVTSPDRGTCRVYAGQYAPRYTGRRTASCPTSLPSPPPSPYPVYLPGAAHSNIRLAQASIGLTGGAVDGVFGTTTLNALLSYQRARKLPVTGVIDNVTWVTMEAVLPKTPFRQIVASPDVTTDGRADLVAVDAVGRLHVYPGTGDGRLGRVRPFGTGWGALTVHAPGDWNGDGHGDIVAVDAAGALWLYAGDGAGSFRPRKQIGNGWTGFRIVPAGDVDGNGTADLLAIDAADRLWLYPGDGRGGFTARKQVGNGWGGFDLYAAADMNRDGKTDILSIDEAGRLWFYPGRGGGFFSRRAQAGHGWTGFAFASGGDFNGDRVNDLMGRDTAGRLWFYAGRPGGSFAKKVQVGNGW